MSDSADENARPSDELGQAQSSTTELKRGGREDFRNNNVETRQVRKPSYNVEALIAAGLTIVPLIGKVPRDLKWQERMYDSAVVAAAAEGNHNLGVRLSGTDLLVVDADPRNYQGGIDSFERLVADFQIDLDAYPVVRTGGGGVHVYMRNPGRTEIAKTLNGYPGIDLKTSGQVVAPGSVHPDTGLPYVGERMEFLALEAPAPQALIDRAAKSNRMRAVSPNSTDRAGEWSPQMLAKNLAQLDPDEFPEYEPWLEMLMASHHATAGMGLEEFTEWSMGFTGTTVASPELIAEKWHGLRTDGRGITLQYICKQLLDRRLPVHDRTDPEDDFDAVEDPSVISGEPRWRFLSVEELEDLPPPQWLVPGILTEGSIAAIYGAPESGKSFLAVDMSLSVASGIPWHGREVLAGGVLYVAAEGAPGLGKRVRAWKLDKNAASLPVAFNLMRDPLNLTTAREALDFAETVRSTLGELRMIVVDTLNQTAAGADENSAKEMGQYIAGMKRLRDATGAAIVVVHHSGKDETRGMRGSTALLGAMDTTVEVARTSNGTSIEVRIRKQKDAERDPPMRFNLDKVAGSLVLRPTMMAEADADFGGEAIRTMARSLANNGRLEVKELVAALRERDGVADKTARRRIASAIPEGRETARASNGYIAWTEREVGNSRGGQTIYIEAVPSFRGT